MADEPLPPNLDGLVDRFVEAVYDPAKLRRLQRAMTNAQTEAQIVVDGVETAVRTQPDTVAGLDKGVIERAFAALSAWVMSLAVENAFDVDVPNIAFAELGATGNRQAVAQALTRFPQAIFGQSSRC